MRRIIAALFVAAGLVSVSSASNNVINQKNTIYHPGQTFSKTFPYAIGDKVSIFSQADSSVQICAAGVLGCNKVNIPDEVQTSKHHISGPFVSSSTPSWLAIGDDASYLCAVSARQSGASCVKLGEFNGKEVDVTITQKGIVPYIKLTSQIHSNTYVNEFASKLKSSIKSASIILRQSLLQRTSASPELITIAAYPPKYPDQGIGGIAMLKISDIGLTKNSIKEKDAKSKDDGSFSVNCAPIEVDEDGNSTVPVCGNTGDTGDPVYNPPYYDPGEPSPAFPPETGGETPGGCTSTPGPYSCSTLSPLEIRERCLAAADTIYNEVRLPECRRKTSAIAKALCYEAALIENGYARAACEEEYESH